MRGAVIDEEEAQARVLAVAEVLSANLPNIRNMFGQWGSPLDVMTRSRVAEILRNEPKHLRQDQLIELYCLEMIEAVKAHRIVARIG